MAQSIKFKDIILLYPRLYQVGVKELNHIIDPKNRIRIIAKFLDISKIYEPSKDIISKNVLIEELNEVLNI